LSGASGAAQVDIVLVLDLVVEIVFAIVVEVGLDVVFDIGGPAARFRSALGSGALTFFIQNCRFIL